MRIIYPPRPSGKIPPKILPKYEKRGRHLAQRKFNGHRNLVHVTPGGMVSIYGRHGGEHGSYKMARPLREDLSDLNFEKGKEYWIDGELLHPRVPDTVVLYDVLQAGAYLYGVTIEERLDLLTHICRNPTARPDPSIALQCSQHVWMADTFLDQFPGHFQEFIDLDLIEGLVLKERGSRLNGYGYKHYEVNWQIRCRKPGASYGY